MRSLLLCITLVLASCGSTSNQAGTSATPATGGQPTQALAPTTQAPTTAPVQPTQASVASAPTFVPVPTPAASFVVPNESKTSATPVALLGATYAKPDIEQEVRRFFELVYQARSLAPGGSMNVDGLRRLVDGPYADYTIPLFEREVDDAMHGLLREVRFGDLSVKLEDWQ